MFTFDEARTGWFMAWILPHEPALRAWLSRKAGSGIDVDDVVQESYTVLAALEQVDQIRNPRAYLFQVAHSVVVRHIRRSRVVSILAAEDLEGFDPADGGVSPEQAVIDRDQMRRIDEGIAAMPRQMRQVFMLRRMLDLPQREIARRLRVSESTVEKHLARGVKFLIARFGYGGKGVAQTSKPGIVEFADHDERARNQRKH